MGARFLERIQIAAGFVPVDLQAGANDGDWVNLADFGHLAIVFFKAAGTADDDPTLSLEQAQSVGGAGVKPLEFEEIFVKQGADLEAISTFTKITQPAAASYTHGDAAEEQAIWVVEIRAELLDVDNGFSCVRARVADVGGNAQLGALLYIGADARYRGETAPGMIA